ncbi:penicillin-binding protein [Sandaracinomonas limnophila]|nr:penicillin-binding protein [Sandaracinomonas limnophila]
MFFLFKIIFIQGEEYRKEAANTYIKERSIVATRGNIYSSDGSLLVTSLPKYKLGIDPTVYNREPGSTIYNKNIDALAAALSDFYKDKSPEEYKNKIDLARKNKKKYLLINNRLLDFQERKRILKFPLFRERKGDATKTGVVFDKVNVRYAPFGQMAYRTIGYLKDKKAVGLEAAFDKELRGIAGVGLFEKMDKNTWRPIENNEETVPTPGYDLHTTIDINIQDIVETALKNGLTNFKGNYAVGIVMETATGEIKALSNMSKSTLSASGYMETQNHAIDTRNDPGSVFKLPSMMAMMEEDGLELNEMINVGGDRCMFFGRWMSDSHAMGTASVEKIIESSSNIGTMKLMQRTFGGKGAKYYDYLKKFHLIDPIGFQIKSANEKPVFIHPSKWHGGYMLWAAVGYSTSYTPLSIISFYNAIANKGYWVQPLIVKYAKRGGEIMIDYTKSQQRDSSPLCSSKTLGKLQTMLEGVVTQGTATNIKGSVYGIAGKSGTAQKVAAGGGYTNKYYVTFVGYFPAKNPKYTVLVTMDSPEGGTKETNSRQVTAPVFKEISDNIYAQDMKLQKKLSGILPDSVNNNKLSHTLHPVDQDILYSSLGLPKFDSDGKWVKFSLDKKMAINQAISNPAKTVPAVIGMNLRDAIFALENRGLKVRAHGKGVVISQTLVAGSPYQKGAQIDLQLN